MTLLKKLVMICLMLGMTLSVCACDSNDGSAEKAGKEIDKAFDSAKDKLHDATK